MPGSGSSRSWRDGWLTPLEQLPCPFETHPWSVERGAVGAGRQPCAGYGVRSPTAVASAANYWPLAMRLWTGERHFIVTLTTPDQKR